MMSTNNLLETLRVQFDLIDSDESGSINADELVTFIDNLGLTVSRSEIMTIIQEIDLDGNKEIEFNEFLEFLVERVKKESERKAVFDMFQFFDQDGNGYITALELKSVMFSLGESFTDEEIDDMMCEADLDGDNQIDFREFMKILSVEDDITFLKS